jgi:hypothetical protein
MPASIYPSNLNHPPFTSWYCVWNRLSESTEPTTLGLVQFCVADLAICGQCPPRLLF